MKQNLSQQLVIANKLIVKSLQSKSYESVKFVILNDTVHFSFYDQAYLLKIEKGQAKLEGVSGQPEFVPNSEINDHWTKIYSALADPKELQHLNAADLQPAKDSTQALHIFPQAKIDWIPIPVNKEVSFVLFTQTYSEKTEEDSLQLFEEFLLPGYTLALKRYFSKTPVGRLFEHLLSKKGAIALVLLLSLFIVRIPLRVVSPAEVVPLDPYVITAPLDGIIEKIIITPGQQVTKGETLFDYDKRVPLRKLNVYQQEVQVLQSEVDRAIALGLNKDEKSLSELSVLKEKLSQKRLELDLAQVQADQLTVTSPIDGITIINDPSEWSGKPVVVGEKVLSVTNPAQSKVRFWISERDNIIFNQEVPVKVFLNTDPDTTYETTLDYVSKESTISKQNIPVFIGESLWNEQPENVKIGQKGTAILYGENVSLFYYIFRKPWAYLRYLFGT